MNLITEITVNKERGFNVLECLLVLVVIAIVTLISIRHYSIYERNIRIANIKNDIVTIQSALTRYYHEIGCSMKSGIFPIDKRRPNLVILGLNLPGRPPQIPLGNAYQVAIVDTLQKTQDDKPIYALQVTARFSSRYSKKRLQWYQRLLGAAHVMGRLLVWETLPDNVALSTSTKLWVLQSQAEQFRRIENKAWKNEMHEMKRTSASYCAH